MVYLGCTQLFGQKADQVAEVIKAREQQALATHTGSNVAHVLTGRNYHLSYQGAINSQFFRSKYPVTGTLVFEGIVFPEIDVQLDLYSQEVVVLMETKNNSQYVSLDNEKVSEFTFMDYKFVHFPGDSVMTKDIYELAFAGANTSLYIKRQKTRKETLDSSKIIVQFIPNDKYFVTNEYGSFEITNRKSLLSAYYDQEWFKKMLKQKKLKFSKKRIEQSLIMAVGHYDTNTGLH